MFFSGLKRAQVIRRPVLILENSLLEINYIGVFPERLYSVHAAFFRQEYMRHEVKPVDDNPSAVGIIVSAYCFHSEFFQGFSSSPASARRCGVLVAVAIIK